MKLKPEVFVVGVDELALEAHIVIAQQRRQRFNLRHQGLQRGPPKAKVKLRRKRHALPLAGIELGQDGAGCTELGKVCRANG